ncbi:MAG: hypothetical protein LBF13_00830 [Campylobacteraceae bacterium]|jgi:dGTP triphosphohydrolase|nr:hypothetical protein [Campylobacteraceae bacterium]
MYGAADNVIANDIARMGSMIIKTAANVTEGLKSNNHYLFAESMEQLADIDISTNNINNKIVSAIPIFCKDEQTARKFTSYVKIISEFIQVTHTIRYFCKNITDCTSERCYMAIKENMLQLFQTAIEAFAMSSELVKDNGSIKDVFRAIKMEQMKCDELREQIEQSMAGFDMKFTFGCIKIVNITEQIDVISKSASAVAKIIILTQDGGKLRIY